MDELCRKVERKFELASELAEFVRDVEGGEDIADAIYSELGGIQMRYYLAVSGVFNLGGVTQAARSEYSRIFVADDFIGDIHRAARTADRFAAAAQKKKLCDGNFVKDVSSMYKAICDNLSSPIMPENVSQCVECSSTMVVEPSQSYMRCGSCGCIAELVGTVFEDSQFYSQEGQKAKSGSFNPNRHYDFWWMHILALEPVEEIGDAKDPENQAGEKLVAEMRKMSRRDNKILQRLTIDDIRDMLVELGRTDLNKNVSLILKHVTGIGPPTPNEEFGEKIGQYFSRVIEIDERVRPDDKPNRYYYPYYIFKILDGILSEDDPHRRILYYIYLQGDDTLRKDDEVWKSIVAEVSEIDYRPTRRDLRLNYRPGD